MSELKKPPGRGNIVTAVGLVLIVLLMILPIPPMVMDTFLALSISVAMVILVGTLYIERPSDFQSFLLFCWVQPCFAYHLMLARRDSSCCTVMRGLEAAGQVISTFGTFVVGGNYVVGVIVFL